MRYREAGSGGWALGPRRDPGARKKSGGKEPEGFIRGGTGRGASGLTSPAALLRGTQGGAIMETGGQADLRVHETSDLELTDLP